MPHETPIPPKHIGCHRTGFEKKCRDLVVEGVCERWKSEAILKDGKPTTVFDCIDHWQAHYLRDVITETNGFGRAIESLRNELLALTGHPQGHPNAVPTGQPLRQLTNSHELLEDLSE